MELGDRRQGKSKLQGLMEEIRNKLVEIEAKIRRILLDPFRTILVHTVNTGHSEEKQRWELDTYLKFMK